MKNCHSHRVSLFMQRQNVNLTSEHMKKKNQGSWIATFSLVTEMNVTGLLRVDMEHVQNYWSIRRLGLRCTR